MRASLGLPRTWAGRPFLHDPPFVHEDHAVRHLLGEADLVGDDDERHARFGEAADHGQHLGDQLGIERRGGLVEQHQPGRDGERARDRHPLLLPAGEAMRQVVQVAAEADADEQAARRLLSLLLAHAVDMRGRFHDVLERREVVEQVEVLEDHADPGLGPGAGEVAARLQLALHDLVADVLAVHRDLAVVDGLQVVHHPEKGALARAARSHDGHHLAPLHGQVDAAQHVVGPIGLVDVGADHEGLVLVLPGLALLLGQELDPVAGIRHLLADGGRLRRRRLGRRLGPRLGTPASPSRGSRRSARAR